MWKNFKEHVPKFGSGSSEDRPQSSHDQDLTTILDRSQRAELTLLVGEITSRMRKSIEESFHGYRSDKDDYSPSKQDDNKETLHLRHSDDRNEETMKNNREDPELGPTIADLKLEATAISSYDDWRDAVLLRIGEAVNKEDEHESQETDNPSSKELEESQDKRMVEDERSLSKLRSVYPPIDTPLVHLPEAKKLLILHSVLLLLLSLEHYNARSRVLMLNISSSLGCCIRILNGDEVKVARGLLDTALALSGNPDAQEHVKKTDPTRKWKVGIASVVGATLIGVTGGLAAPLVAAGLGTVMGGLGLGATAAATYLGALAGSGVIVGGLFGAYGGRMTGRMVDKYAREVRDFAFIPTRGPLKKSEDDKEAAKEDHRLRVTIGVTGWVTEEDNYVVPWQVVGSETEVFALRWEYEPLLNLGTAMDLLVTSAAWSAGEEVVKKTVFAGLLSAVALPLGLMKVSKVADNPFSVAKARADKAGEVLADALISKVQGERSVTLMGYSLGSRVIYSCLQSLAKRGAYGLVESAILMGSPTPSDTQDWRRLRGVVSGRLVNVYSENDSVLALLYRTSSLQFGVAGLEPVQHVPWVENLDVSDIVSGHLRYQFLIGRIINMVGLQSIDIREVQRNEAALRVKTRRQEEERMQNEREAGIEPGNDKGRQEPDDAIDEGQRIQMQLERRTQDQLPSRRGLSEEGERPPLPSRRGVSEEGERPRLPIRPARPS